jgi:proteic killer suppression protein
MIESFSDADTEKVFQRLPVKRFSADLQRSALRKLLILDASETLQDLRIPPANRLEKLRGDRRGQYSIRVNEQWRICFRWMGNNAHDVELVDYH